MSSRMILIAPAEALEQLPRREHHLLLPDLVEASPSYGRYYAVNRFHGRVILDNGAFEGFPKPHQVLVDLGSRLGCTHIVLPDDITGSDPSPLETFLRHLKVYPPKFRYIYVIHGRTPEKLASRAMEVVRYRIEHPEHDFDLAISSLALRFQSHLFDPILDRCYVRPRALMTLREIFMNEAQTRGMKLDWVHLLGAVSYQEILSCINILTTFVHEVTFDTCDPVKEATTWSTRTPYNWREIDQVDARLRPLVEKWDKL